MTDQQIKELFLKHILQFSDKAKEKWQDCH